MYINGEIIIDLHQQKVVSPNIPILMQYRKIYGVTMYHHNMQAKYGSIRRIGWKMVRHESEYGEELMTRNIIMVREQQKNEECLIHIHF